MNENRRLLSTSTAHCAECGTSHQSAYEVVDGRVLYSIECPRRCTETVVSSEADIFTTLRSRQGSTEAGPAACTPKYQFYVVAITDRCNFECPICFAEASLSGRRFLTMDEVRRAAMAVKANGGRRLSLSGGEPTMHPELIQLVRVVRQEIGLSPTLITNGLRIGEDLPYLRDLKAAGLRRIHLQFDTLDGSVYRVMRGRSDPSEKLRAVDHVLAAGLRLGLITTVCELNLGELGRLLEYSQQLVPALRIHVFQPAVPVGRYPANLRSVTREDVIRALAHTAGKYELRETDFLPFPTPGSGTGAAHPDCSAHVLMCSDRTRGRPLHLHAWGSISQREDAGGAAAPGPTVAEVLPSGTVGERKGLARRRRRRRWHPFFVSIVGFMRPQARDDQRLQRCLVASISGDSLTPLCERGCSLAPRSRRSR